jgi:hypothetical protein
MDSGSYQKILDFPFPEQKRRKFFCHAAIIAWERSIPYVVGTRKSTEFSLKTAPSQLWTARKQPFAGISFSRREFFLGQANSLGVR